MPTSIVVPKNVAMRLALAASRRATHARARVRSGGVCPVAAIADETPTKNGTAKRMRVPSTQTDTEVPPVEPL